MPLKNNRSKKKIHFFKKKNKSKRCGGRGGRNMGEASSSSDNSSGSGSLRKSSSSSEESSSSSSASSSAPSSSSSEESSSISSLSSSVEPSSPSSSSSEESSSSSSIGSLPSANASSSSRRSSIGVNSGDIMDATIINQNNPQRSPSGEKLSSVALLEELLKESGPKLISSTRSSSAKISPVKVPSARVSSVKAPSPMPSYSRQSSKQKPVRENSSDVMTLARGVTCLRRDYNPKSRRCLIPCKNGQARNPNNNRCAAMPKNNGPNLRQSMANLPVENIGNVVPPCGGRTEDFNPRTKRCLKPCEPNTRRNQQTMRCVKVLNVAPAQEVRSRQASIRRSPSGEAIVVGQEAQEMFAEPVQQMQRAQSPKKMTLKQKNTLRRFNQNSSQNSTRKVIHLLARRYQFDPVDATTYINKKLAIKTRYSE